MKKITRQLVLLLTVLMSLETTAADFSLNTTANITSSLTSNQTALPADTAFNLSAMIKAPSTIVLMWEIEDGYYLYRKSLQISENGDNKLQSATIPTGNEISDEFFGKVEVYYNKLLVELPFIEEELSRSKEIQLELHYQGCAEIGYCYPIQQKRISLEIP